MNNYLSQPILITGIERSGSSIIAKLIKSCKIHAGSVNEMGENLTIKRLVSNYYTSVLKVPENGQKPLPNVSALNLDIDWEKAIGSLLIQEGYKGDRPWMYKSFRIAQTWPIWASIYPDAKWVIVRRKTPDIIQSCLKTAFMNAYTDKEGWLDWVHQHENLFIDIIKSNANYIEIWPERMAIGDYSQIYEMLEWLGLEWNDSILTLTRPLFKNSLKNKM